MHSEIDYDDSFQQEDAEDIHYSAFISHSHEDAKTARKLVKLFSQYGVPDDLVGKKGAFGTISEKLLPAFLDRSHLDVGKELSDSIADGLKQSGCLIVICSPASRNSRWVNQEIRTFREVHPQRDIIPVIPRNVLKNIGPNECFPDELSAYFNDNKIQDPVTVDLRPGADTLRTAFPRIVARVLRFNGSLFAKYGISGVRLRRRVIFWLRWVGLVPLSLAAPFVARLIFELINFFGGIDNFFWKNIVGSVIEAGAFLGAGYGIAPSHQRIVVIAMSGFLIFFAGFVIAITIMSDPRNGPQYLASAIHAAVAGYGITSAIKNFENMN